MPADLTSTDTYPEEVKGPAGGDKRTAKSVRDMGSPLASRSYFLRRRLEGVWGAFKAFAATDISLAADTITIAGHGLSNNDPIRFASLGTAFGVGGVTLPVYSGLFSGQLFYAKVVDADTIQIAASSGGAALDLTGQGSGTHVLFAVPTALHTLMHQAFTTAAGATIPAGSLLVTLAAYFLPLSGGELTGDVTPGATGNIRDRLISGNIPSVGNADLTLSTFEQYPTWRCIDQSANHIFTLPTPSKAGLRREIHRNDFTAGFAALFKRAADASTIGRLPGTAASGSAGLLLRSYDSGDGKGVAWHATALGNADQCT